MSPPYAFLPAALIGTGILFIGLRFLISPRAAAAAFGVPGVTTGDVDPIPWFYVKGVRDIACGFFTILLLAQGQRLLLGEFILAATFVPFGDALIVLRSGGTKAAAFGIHGATAIVMIAIAGVLILG